MLYDFETDAELDRIHWKCHTLFSLSDKYVTHGKKSLKMELYPSDYPGFSPILKMNNWQNYKAICFEVFSTDEKDLKIAVRIDDREELPAYQDRYNEGYTLKPGQNQIHILLDTLVTSGTKRPLNLRGVYKFLIFMSHPKNKHVLYVDNIRLVS